MSTPPTFPPYASDPAWFQEQIFEASPLGSLILEVTDSSPIIVYINTAFVHLTGYTRHELLGKDFRFLQPAGQAEWQIIDDSLRDQTACVCTVRNTRKDGSRFWDEIHQHPLKDRQGHVTHWLVCHQDVTQAREHLYQLEAQNALFQLQSSALAAAANASVITDINGVVEWCNPAYTQLTGYSSDELYGRHPRDLIQSGLMETEFYTGMWRTILSGRVWQGQVINQRKDGTLYTVMQTITPVLDQAGQIYRFIAIQEDITERQKIEHALYESATLNHSLIASLSEGVVLQSADGIIQICNAAAERILGMSADQMMGRSSIDAQWKTIHEDGIPFPGEEHPAIVTLRTGKAFSQVIMGVYKPNQDLAWISINTQPIFEAHSDQPSAVVASLTDITLSKKMEIDLKASETRLRNLVELMQDIVWSIDLKTWEVMYLNHKMEDIYGYTARAFLDNNQLWYELIHPDDRALVTQSNEAVVEEGGKDIEYRIVRSDGTIRWLRDRAWIVLDERGQAVRLEGLVTDNTAYKQAQEQAFEMALEKERVQLLTTFIQHAAHEFRTPLAIITSSMYMMAKSENVEKREQYANRVEVQVERITKLLDNVLVVVSLRSGAVPSHSKVDIVRLLQMVQADLRKEINGAHILYKVAVVPPIQGHEDNLYEAFKQLLGNALRYTPADGRIIMRVQNEDDNIMVEIADTGKGIQPDALDSIFGTFWREDEAHTTPGFGLGLSIAKSIIEMHGGTIEVESKVGEGSVFKVRLPVKR